MPAKKKQKKHRLTDINITEISLVDKAANNRFFIYKQLQQDSAVDASCSANNDDPVINNDFSVATNALSVGLEALATLHAAQSAYKAD